MVASELNSGGGSGSRASVARRSTGVGLLGLSLNQLATEVCLGSNLKTEVMTAVRNQIVAVFKALEHGQLAFTLNWLNWLQPCASQQSSSSSTTHNRSRQARVQKRVSLPLQCTESKRLRILSAFSKCSLYPLLKRSGDLATLTVSLCSTYEQEWN